MLHELVREQARRRPTATAVVMDREVWSYAELDARSSVLAGHLREIGCERGHRVALLCRKSPLAVTAILAALKADTAYVPLDPETPVARTAKILAQVDPACILADSAGRAVLNGLMASEALRPSCRLGWLEPGEEPPGELPIAFVSDGTDGAPPPVSRGNPEDPAYVMFTSGSTGMPKGVVITHRNVLGFLSWAVPYFGLTSADRVSGYTPFHFDLSVFDLFGTLAAGASLYLVPSRLSARPDRVAAFIRDSGITQWFSVPGVLAYLAKFDVVRFNDFPRLRRVLWCGEVLPTPVLIYWMERLPHVQFTNLYGPTETTIASTYHTITRRPVHGREAIPIGRACGGEYIILLDETGRPVGPGEIGEICIGGAGVGLGYWQDPDKTRASFVPNPLTGDPRDRLYRTGDLGRLGPDGFLYFLGRADTQIKTRGYRVELGEIEAALAELHDLLESAVVALPSAEFDALQIACAYVPRPGCQITADHLRAELRRRIPSYMIPVRWRQLERLPRNANGKVDRQALKLSFQHGDAPLPLT